MKVLGLNTGFYKIEHEGFEEEKFSTPVSLLDYDAVVIDIGDLIESCYGTTAGSFHNKMRLSEYSSAQIVEDFSRIKEQIKELLKQGRNIFILMGQNDCCYIYTGEKQFSGTGKNTRTTNIVNIFNPYSFLPIAIKATHIYGCEIDFTSVQPYHNFFNHTIDNSQYASYYSIDEPHKVLARIKGTDKVVAAVVPFENGKIICLPQPFYEGNYDTQEEWITSGSEYLDSLLNLIADISTSTEDYVFPEWANHIFIPKEKEELSKQESIENKIDNYKLKLVVQKELVANIQKYKLLLTSSGKTLEGIVQQVLCEFGFTMLDAAEGRSDIVAKYDKIGVVAEVKGVTKSAAEKHAAQLEKWVSEYIEKYGGAPKALLIVNGYCDTPLAERTEEVFPDQMLNYSKARGHALITTTQLLCMYIDIQQNPRRKNAIIKELFSCVGRCEKYKNINDYLDFEE